MNEEIEEIEEILVRIANIILTFWLEHDHWTKTEFNELEDKVTELSEVDDVEVEDVQLEVANQCLYRGIEYTEQLQAFVGRLL